MQVKAQTKAKIKEPVIISGIIKHHKGYGFKITFDSFAEASKYKDQAYYIINVDGYKINNVKGYSE